MDKKELITTPFPFPQEKQLKQSDEYFYELEHNLTSLFNLYHLYYKKKYNTNTPFILNPEEMKAFQQDYQKIPTCQMLDITDSTETTYTLEIDEIPCKKANSVVMLLNHVLENDLKNWRVISKST